LTDLEPNIRIVKLHKDNTRTFEVMLDAALQQEEESGASKKKDSTTLSQATYERASMAKNNNQKLHCVKSSVNCVVRRATTIIIVNFQSSSCEKNKQNLKQKGSTGI
jgi:hypothetical protein